MVSIRNSRYRPRWITFESMTRSSRGSGSAGARSSAFGSLTGLGPPDMRTAGPSRDEPAAGGVVVRSGRRDGLAGADERGARLRVEQVDLVGREAQLDDVARADPVRRVDDRD